MALALAGALAAGACSSPPTSGGGGAADRAGGSGATLPVCPVDALKNAPKPVTIDLWYGGLVGATKTTMDDIVGEFNRSQHDVVVRASDQGAAYQEADRAFESAAAAGSGDQLPDIAYLEDIQLASLADSKLILPAQACMEADGYDLRQLEPVARAQYSVDGALYPGYMNMSMPVLYYNKAHFVKAGLDPDKPPRTLDELFDAARKLKAAGVSPKPFALKTDRWYFESWLNGADVDIVNHDNGRTGQATAASFDGARADDLLGFLKKMNDQGLLNPVAATEGTIDDYLALVTQQSSMVVETSTAASTIKGALAGTITARQAGVDFNDSVLDRNQLVPGSAPFPGLSTGGQALTSGGGFYLVNRSDKPQQAAAWQFLRFMLRPDIAKQWHIEGSYLPIVKSVADEPDVQKFWTDDLAGVLLKPAVDQFDAADPDRPGPLIGPYPDEEVAVQGAMDGVLFKHQDIKTSLAKASDDVTASLRRYAG